MKFSYQWLARWVRLDIGAEDLAARLTTSGLEVDSVSPVATQFEGVVVARIIDRGPHPDADRLSLCTVDDGSGEPVQVVCGAPNARAGLTAPFARVGATIGPDMKIRRARLRGVESHGMLCSARELGLSDDHAGLMELPADAPVGRDLSEWLDLDDCSIEVDLTPNRADCLSIRGLARDVSASCAAEFTPVDIVPVEPGSSADFPIRLDAPEDCARYAGRVIEGLDTTATSPLWLQEALRRCGVRSISPVVDVTNYVMLELGQPMHAFDLDRLHGGISVRRGNEGEKLTLLDGSEVDLDPEILAICDENGPVALAGIMGGETSAVTDATNRVLLESAWFRPSTIMGKARRYGMHTDASHRFERGVDPQGQVDAIERATTMLLDICGGTAGPVLLAEAAEHLPSNQPVLLRHQRLEHLVGMPFERDAVESILARLGMQVETTEEGWRVTAPSARTDIEREEDLIEEVARIHGYDHIPEKPPGGEATVGSVALHDVPLEQLREALCSAGYFEAINYSFVDRRLLQTLHMDGPALALANPLASDMDVMRTSLVPGLLTALQHNLNRQHDRVRLFETGRVFEQNGSLRERSFLAGVATGLAQPEQWAQEARPMDFFDIKGDVECLLQSRGDASVTFAPLERDWAHPGASAVIHSDGAELGWCGALHPGVLEQLDIGRSVFAFELDLDILAKREIPYAKSISRFPSVRRDLALWVPEGIPYAELHDCVVAAAGELLQKLVVFDVYHDETQKKGYKSLAIGLILQNVSSTLTDEDADPVIKRVVSGLEQELKAQLRG
ncbi:phenylalanine--tRNA ligase subunit beta [Elongatibacter sediminis]|uniref:Phenylalanine--tRNA ligase beta subunit n=1 Tax=Elongatibacter sediminis TaxID=3119006 RepID=A0AAW9RFK3_9GAMM